MQTEADTLTTALLGRKIVSVRRAKIDYDGSEYDDAWEPMGALMTLDDGTTVAVRPNEGCGGCSSGWYALTRIVDSIDNVITSVEETVTPDEPEDDWWDQTEKTYEVYVVAAEKQVNLFTIEGDDGNGYYGTGYSIIVKRGS